MPIDPYQVNAQNIANARQMGAILQKQAMQPRQVGPNSGLLQGLVPIIQALAGKKMKKRADDQEAEDRAMADALRKQDIANILGPQQNAQSAAIQNAIGVPIPQQPQSRDALIRGLIESRNPKWQDAGMAELIRRPETPKAPT